MKRAFCTIASALALLALPASAQEVANSPHNLSVSGPGPVKATTETEICIFCHTPHNSLPQAPLWNRQDPGSTYILYTSSTLKGTPGQPSGATRLCLSCHDGTIALGAVRSRPAGIAMSGSSTMPPGHSLLGVDLSDDHPVSLDYAGSTGAGGYLPNPAHAGRSLLDPLGRVQCTSCHDAHDNSKGAFLIADSKSGALCGLCHIPNSWPQSSHATSQRTWNGSGTNPWPGTTYRTTAEGACSSCHTTHSAPAKYRLLRNSQEEVVCFSCHRGTVAPDNIETEIRKFSAHDAARYMGTHDAAETPDGRRTHVECADCHNPHRTNATAASGTGLPGALQGVSGLDTNGIPVTVASREHEICYKCHADTTDQNPDRIPRLATQPNMRLRFDPANPSYHPVEVAGKNPDGPSLKPGYTVSSVIRCTDCHNNDTGPGAGGTGPAGPHGSRWDFLLERQFDTRDPVTETSATYALCYKCHDRTSILNDQSFKEHRKHIQGEDTSCSICHDPHGIDVAQSGLNGNNTHLINFDRRYVTPNRDGRLEFRDLGRFRGSCSLLCHGMDHRDESYAR